LLLYSRYIIEYTPMGKRKVNNKLMAKLRLSAKIRRDKKRRKREAKGKTPGQLLADKMVAK
jgi:hypothetical protein